MFNHKISVVRRIISAIALNAVLVIGLLLIAACQPIQPAPAGETPVAVIEPGYANAPVNLAIPAIDMDVAVIPTGWQVIERNGVRTTEWVTPEDTAGWHVNSAGAGEEGNTIISGHQATGAAVFAPIALEEVAVGQEIVVTGADGLEHRYIVTEVSKPLPIDNPSQEESRQIAAYLAPGDTARLTLITGWPAFTTSHRVFVVAEATK
jgi:sortase (surface protein transpeptidase)